MGAGPSLDETLSCQLRHLEHDRGEAILIIPVKMERIRCISGGVHHNYSAAGNYDDSTRRGAIIWHCKAANGTAAEADSFWRSVQKLPVRSWAQTVWEVLAFFSRCSRRGGRPICRHIGGIRLIQSDLPILVLS